LEKRQLTIQTDAFEYLVTLLTRFMEAETFFARTADGKLGNDLPR
jgi:hypothetical protein